ncbi:MAG: hypothetical protein BWY66_01523 [bacterium ADurb.Bin374]|nr:MAG: hypothetical protein BWY66_01523 [bacterium ADurb.Bin374]
MGIRNESWTIENDSTIRNAMTASWQPTIQRRFVEWASTSGPQSILMIHGQVMRLVQRPMSAFEMPSFLNMVTETVLTMK